MRIGFDKHSHRKGPEVPPKIVPSAIPEWKASGIRRLENSSLQKKGEKVRAPSPEIMIAGTNCGHFETTLDRASRLSSTIDFLNLKGKF